MLAYIRTHLLLFILFLSGSLLAQNGSITGVVTDKSDGSTIPGAVLSIDSAKIAGITDFDGKFKISLAPGIYDITCKTIGMAPQTIKGVRVEAGKQSVANFEMDAGIGTDATSTTVEIWGTRNTENTVSAVEDVHDADVTEDIMPQAEMKRTFVQSAADAARKMPGVTVVDNRFVIVRGLSERYNAVLLNNVFAPSVESDVKAFSFDLIPSQMLDRFTIYKSPSADLPGEFSGGAIRLTTRNIPEQTNLTIGYSVGYRAGTTFQPFALNRVGNSDLLGFGGGSRLLPSNFPDYNLRGLNVTPDQLLAASQTLPNTWNHTSKNASPDQRFNLTWSVRESKVTGKGKQYQFGNITSFNYSLSNQFFINSQYDYNVYNQQTQESDSTFAYRDSTSQQRVRLALIQNNAMRFGKSGQHNIQLKNLLNQLGDNETVLRGGPSFENGEDRKEYSYRYIQRLIYTGQLNGEHSFFHEKTKVDWTLAYSAARRKEPDWRRARYARVFGSAETDPYQLYIPFQAVPFYLGRLFIDMEEDVKAATANLEQVISFGKDSSKYEFTLKAGIYAEDKIRSFGIRSLGYRAASFQTYLNYDLYATPIDQVFSNENINTTNGLLLDEDTRLSDSYVATNNLRAAYALVVLPFGKFTGKKYGEELPRLKVNAGVRAEDNVQKLFSNRTNNIADSVRVNNDTLTWLPSINIAVNITDRIVLRGSYGRTINRPEFREIAPLTFYDFAFNSIYQGNSDLKLPYADNYDMRFEFYPRPGENITMGLFYKQFTNPIETYFFPGLGSGGVRGFTWGNAARADNYGIELEARRKFDQIEVPVIRHLGVVANAAYIVSNIRLGASDTSTFRRPMMGQSPYVINLGLYWQNDSTGWQINAAYNVVGPRVVIAGIPSLEIPDVYEMPRHQIDFSVIKTIGKTRNIDLRFNVSDILNMESLLLQDANQDGKLDRNNDQRIQAFRRGAYFTFGVNVRLFDPPQTTNQ